MSDSEHTECSDEIEPLCLDLGGLRWRLGVCGDDDPNFECTSAVEDERVAAHPLAATFGAQNHKPQYYSPSVTSRVPAHNAAAGLDDPDWQPGLAGTEPMLLVHEVMLQAIAGAPGARQYLWDLKCEALERRLRSEYGGGPPRDVVCTLPLFTELASAEMVKRLQLFFGESGPFRQAGIEVNRLLFAHAETLALYSSGRTTGMVLNLGHAITILPIFEGYAIECAARRHAWPPTGQALLPHLVSIVLEALDACPCDTQREFAVNIVVSGQTHITLEQLRCRSLREFHLSRASGAETSRSPTTETTESVLRGLQEALQENGRHKRYKVILPPERDRSTWIGGSILGSLTITPWAAESWLGPNANAASCVSNSCAQDYCADKQHGIHSMALSHGCYWPETPASLIVQSDKTASLAFAAQLLAWATATRHCSVFDENFDFAVVSEIGAAMRAAWLRRRIASEQDRGPALQSDACEMVPFVKAEERSAVKPVCDENGTTWQDIWNALARTDNHVPDKLGQVHSPPQQLDAMQQAGLLPVRCAPWLLCGRNWYGNMNHE